MTLTLKQTISTLIGATIITLSQLPLRAQLMASEYINILDFGAGNASNTITQTTTAIQSALDYAETVNKTVLIPAQKFTINKTLLISPNTSLVGTGPSSIIEADFKNWVNNNNAIIDSKLNSSITTIRGRIIQNFGITANSSTSEISPGTVGIRFTSPGSDIYQWGLDVRNICIEKVQEAIHIEHLAECSFNNIKIQHCTIGINIFGQSINSSFDNIHFNFPTESTLASRGFTIDESADSPEGITLTNSTFLGARTNLEVGRVYHFVITNCIFDMAQSDCIVVRNPDNLILSNNYIESNNNSAIIVNNQARNTDGLYIDNNIIIAKTFGIYFFNGTSRREVHITKNRFRTCPYPILMFAVPNYSEISNNTFSGASEIAIRLYGNNDTGIGLSVCDNKSMDELPILLSNGLNKSFLSTNNFSKLNTPE